MASVSAFEKGWLKSSTGSNGPLTLAEEDPARRARKGLGLDRKAGGPTPERSAASGVAAGPVCQLWRGSPDRPGRATGTGRSALGQRLDRAAGSKWGSLFPSTGRSPERRRQCYSEKGNNGNKTGLIPTRSRALGVTKSVLPKGEMVTV